MFSHPVSFLERFGLSQGSLYIVTTMIILLRRNQMGEGEVKNSSGAAISALIFVLDD
jgi:hypothetical protein